MRAKVVLMLLAFVGVACGAPSGLDACKHSCDWQAEQCGVDTTGCKDACDAQKQQYDMDDQSLGDNCKNASAIRQKNFDCYAQCDVNAAGACSISAYAGCIGK